MNKREIDQFREHIQSTKSGLHHVPYTVNKGKIMVYKAIFLGLGLLFMVLGLWLYSSVINWHCPAIFENCENMKNFLIGFCYFIGFISIVYSLMMKPEQEIASLVVKKALNRAKKIHKKKMMQFSYERVVAGTYTYNQVSKYRAAYHDILDKVHLIETDAMLLIKRISISRVMKEEEKENLYNQAIEDLQHKLHSAVHEFYEEEDLD
ncbi:MAG: hypothetical protein H7A37_09235 [Chlamydiales bacterium]|nr:hypothetical protein [Chlamydiia bacterium]MCP5508460.1 hypothetical protein [Chlamydiales bacterium]